MNFSLDNPALFVAHDAGGAELIAAWARKHLLQDYACVAEGPARRIFASTATRLLERADALSRLAEFRTILTGTSWGSDLEKIFIERGTALGIRTITYLDHWTDYRERFVADGRLVLPSEIWVADVHAERIARSAFPGQLVLNAGNCYLDEIAAQVKALSLPAQARAGKQRALFMSEPLSAAAERKHGDGNYFGYTEFDALAGFLEHARQHWAQELEAVRIRRHPSEAPGKFSAFVNVSPPFPVVECGEAPLVEDCAWADWIAGCQSMALVVGLFAGKQVFSAIPAGGRPSPIPYPGIAPLFQPRPRAQVQGTTT